MTIRLDHTLVPPKENGRLPTGPESRDTPELQAK
jgi:hypothetical protein